MEQEKIQAAIQVYIEKYKELETAKTDLLTQRDQIAKQLTNVEQNMIFLQGSVRALQELLDQAQQPESATQESKEIKEKK